MFVVEMLIKSLGIDPVELQNQVKNLLADVDAARKSMERQERLLVLIAKAQGINPADASAEPPKEIEHGE